MHEPQGRVLILGGSGEAFALAKALDDRPRFDVISSMAGVTNDPKLPVGEVRFGGFGGAAGLTHYLREENIAAVIDATHPFAQNISRSAAEAAAAAEIPILHFWRPEWRRQDGDEWIEVDSMGEAAAAIPANAGPVFLTVGKTELAPFKIRSDIKLVARVIDPVDPVDWPENFEFVYDRGPFDLAAEQNLFAKYGIKSVVTKNSGGAGALPKLEVARALGLPVVMIRRPSPPSAAYVGHVDEAVLWLEGRVPEGAEVGGT